MGVRANKTKAMWRWPRKERLHECKMERSPGTSMSRQGIPINSPLYRDASGRFTNRRKRKFYGSERNTGQVCEELDEFDGVLLRYTDRG